jgi:hypothetical protein
MKENKKILGISVSPLEQKQIDLLNIKQAIEEDDRSHYGTYFVDRGKRNRMHECAVYSTNLLDIDQALAQFADKVENEHLDMSEVGSEILIFQLVGIKRLSRKISITPAISPPKPDKDDE